jgi:hypothetical protein
MIQIMEEFKVAGKKITNVEKAFLAEQGLKWCSKCKSAKLFDDFSKDTQSAGGYCATCKDCVKTYRQDTIGARKLKAKEYYLANRELKIQQAAEYRKNNPDKVVKLREKYYESKKDVILQKNAEYRVDNIEKVALRQKEHHQENKVHRNLIASKWRKDNLEHCRDRSRERYQSVPEVRLNRACREMVRRMFLSIGRRKDMSVNSVLGYSPNDLKLHLEKQFVDGMSWDNYGVWSIDHIIPISTAKTLADGIVLSRLENLRPLWAVENSAKGNRY